MELHLLSEINVKQNFQLTYPGILLNRPSDSSQRREGEIFQRF